MMRFPYHWRTWRWFANGDAGDTDGLHERRAERAMRHVISGRRTGHAARPNTVHDDEGGAMQATTCMALVLTVVAGLLVGCATAPASRPERETLLTESASALKRMSAEDPGVGALVKRGSGYTLFPTVTKGGLVVGGARGQGVLYEQGRHTAYCDLTQATVGLQAGGQTFSELLVFESKAALDRFKAGQLAFATEASAVVLKTGVSTGDIPFVEGVAVVVSPIGGAMVEAAIGGQQFTCQAR
jgi:lipid-binding SYLF domain-containing protein